MLKFFRKYNKVILVVGGTILMVIFLLPAGLSQMVGSRFAQPVASIGGVTITLDDVQTARLEVQALTRVIPSIIGALPLDQSTFGEHWIMLRDEAGEAGLIGGPNDGRRFLPYAAALAVDQYFDRLSLQFGGVFIEQMRVSERTSRITAEIERAEQGRLSSFQSMGLTIDQMDQALADARGIYRMIRISDPSTVYSRPEAIELAHQLRDTATIGAVIYPASLIANGLSDPSEEELQAHFDQFQDVAPADDDYGIGYVLPPAAQIEWIQFDAQVLSDRLTLDPIEVNKHYLQNRNQYPGEIAVERERVETAYRRARVETILNRLDLAMQRELARSTANLEGTATRKILPPGWDTIMPQRAALIAEIERVLEEEFDLAQGEKVVMPGSAPTWNDASTLAVLTPAGSALQFNTRTTIRFIDYVMQVQELGGNEQWRIQVGLFNTIPLRQRQATLQDRFYVRILEVREEGSAASLEEVRTQATADWKLLEAIAELEAQLPTFLDQAIELGLGEASANWDLEYVANLEVTELRVSTPADTAHPTLNVEALRGAIIAQARTLDPTTPLLEVEGASKALAMIVPEARGLVAIEIVDWVPMTIESYRNAALDVASYGRSAKFPAELVFAFSFEALSKRRGFERLIEFDDPDEDAAIDGDDPLADGS